MCDLFYGKVIHGLGRGKSFGFPTINIKLNNSELYIESGVYVVSVTINDQIYKGMLYVGTRPTFDLLETTIEIHIFDFNKDVYDQQISFQLFQKIREEIQFDSKERLIEQLHRDREILHNYSSMFFNSSIL
jgi:riboflavin kinase/FMN adenylyltransferase